MAAAQAPSPAARSSRISDQIAQRLGADIAQEDPGGMPVPVEEAQHRAYQRQGELVEVAETAEPEGQHRQAEADARRLAAGDAVDAVHEVEQIDEPEPGEAGQEGVEGLGQQPAGELPIGQRPHEPEAEGDGGDLDGQARPGGDAAEIVPPADGGERQGPQELRPEPRLDQRPGRQKHGQHGDAAAARRRRLVAAALIRPVQDLPAQQPALEKPGQPQAEEEAKQEDGCQAERDLEGRHGALIAEARALGMRLFGMAFPGRRL